MARARGMGSIFQRASDGLWVIRVTLPTVKGEPSERKVAYAKTEAEAQAKLVEIHAEHPPQVSTPNTRNAHLQSARILGTHTRKEWRAKVAALPHLDRYWIGCFYCEERVHTLHVEKDHYIPVSRGGSDGLDNLVATCRRCNRDKGTLTGDEYLAYIGRRSWEGIA